MLKMTSWRKNSLTNQEPRSERSSLCCTLSEYRFWWDVALGRWPTRWSIRDHRKACLAIGLLAFRRVIAQPRTDLDRERTLVPPRLYALLRLQSTLRLGFWTFLLSIILLSSILFCSLCALMLLNRLRIAPVVFFEVGAPNSWAWKYFRQIPRWFAGASFLVQSLFMWYFLEFWRKDYAHEVHTFG